MDRREALKVLGVMSLSPLAIQALGNESDEEVFVKIDPAHKMQEEGYNEYLERLILDHPKSNELAYAFLYLSETIVRFAKFTMLDEDDSVQEGVLACYERLDDFDPKKGEAFNYFTTVILNRFRLRYQVWRRGKRVA